MTQWQRALHADGRSSLGRGVSVPDGKIQSNRDSAEYMETEISVRLGEMTAERIVEWAEGGKTMLGKI